MVRKGIKFSDGTRIFYEDANGFTQRFIEYAYSPQEKREMQEKPYVKSIIQSSVRKYNAGKYYYLKILFGISHGLDFEHKQQLYSELKTLHDSVGQEYDSKIINEDFKLVFGIS